MPAGVRSISFRFRWVSKVFICFITAVGERYILSAAFVKLPQSVTRTKVSRRGLYMGSLLSLV